MMGSMKALSNVIQRASANNFAGSAVLNLLQSQVNPYIRDNRNYINFGCFLFGSNSHSHHLFLILTFCLVQAKAMAGDNGVRSLLEKMTECASNAYLGILERYFFLLQAYCQVIHCLSCLQLTLRTCNASLLNMIG